MVRRFLFILAAPALVATLAWADKVIMKDGKIYEGRVMGETSTSVLISNPPLDPKPRFLDIKDVMTIVRESHPTETTPTDDRRFASVSLGPRLQVFSSSEFSFAPAFGLGGGGAFRLHPFLEVGGEFVFTPHLSRGGLSVSNGTVTRNYERFYAYQGGFSTKLFPFYKYSDWRMEPYLTTGYAWNRLIPKASGDVLMGRTFNGGAGVYVPWWKPLYWDFRFVYEHTDFHRIEFLTNEGELSGVTLDTLVFSVGLSWRFR